MTRYVVVFGNCQAEALADAFRGLDDFRERHTILYARSFNITADDLAQLLSSEVRDNCEFLIEQVTPSYRLSKVHTFPNARSTATFPSLDMNLLWPLRADDPRTRPEPPEFPYGRFTYGDKIINAVVRDGLHGDAGWEAFQSRSAELMPDLRRFEEIEKRRWAFAERDLDVKVSDLVFPVFRQSRNFWTYNHCNAETLRRVGARILQTLGIRPREDEALRTMEVVFGWDFGAGYHAPVHPIVADELELDWWNKDILYSRGTDQFSYEEFVRKQIDWT